MVEEAGGLIAGGIVRQPGLGFRDGDTSRGQIKSKAVEDQLAAAGSGGRIVGRDAGAREDNA